MVCRVRLPDGSRMTGDCQVRFCEQPVGKFHRLTLHKLHWVLDVVFNDDQSRIRKGNAPRNMAILKKTVLNLLQVVKKNHPRTSFKAMRKMAGWNSDFLHEVLTAQF